MNIFVYYTHYFIENGFKIFVIIHSRGTQFIQKKFEFFRLLKYFEYLVPKSNRIGIFDLIRIGH